MTNISAESSHDGSEGLLNDFDALYSDVAPAMRRIAWTKFAIPTEEAEGLVHDVFATYLGNRRGVTKVRPYLIAGICNAARQYWRRRRSEASLFTSDDAVTLLDDSETCGHKTGSAQQRDESERLANHDAIAATLMRLEPRCRETLRRYYIEDESAADIATALNTTATYVNQCLHLCRKRALAVYKAITVANRHAHQ